jgi:AhpD family alkylhydroperoxidase
MEASYKSLMTETGSQLRHLRKSQPDMITAFNTLGQASMTAGTLDAPTKELIALAIAIAGRCDACIGYHVKGFIEKGGSRAQLDEMLAVTVYMGGGPSLMYAAAAIKAHEELTAA